MSERLQFKYPYAYAARVWEIFESQHLAACQRLLQAYKLPANHGIRLIAAASPRWHRMKKSVRLVEKLPADATPEEVKKAVDAYWSPFPGSTTQLYSETKGKTLSMDEFLRKMS